MVTKPKRPKKGDGEDDAVVRVRPPSTLCPPPRGH